MDYDGCLDSKCCVNPGFDCYKRPTVEYAQCRPVDLACADNNQWLCPGWESCAAHMGDCTGSHCCSNDGRANHARMSAVNPGSKDDEDPENRTT